MTLKKFLAEEMSCQKTTVTAKEQQSMDQEEMCLSRLSDQSLDNIGKSHFVISQKCIESELKLACNDRLVGSESNMNKGGNPHISTDSLKQTISRPPAGMSVILRSAQISYWMRKEENKILKGLAWGGSRKGLYDCLLAWQNIYRKN